MLRAILKVFFYLLYQPFAWTYDWVADIVSVGLWKDWVQAVLPYLEGPRVLELGHGPGHLQLAMMRKGLIAFGLDASRQMSRRAGRLLVGEGLDLLLVNGFAQYIPFYNHTFNQVVATFPSEYIMDSRTLEEIQRILLPGGNLVLIPLAWITGTRPLEKAAGWLFHVTGQAPEWDERALAPLREAGFQNIQVEMRKVKSSQVLVVIAKV